MHKKIVYGLFGFVMGFFVANVFFTGELKAQFDSSSSFNRDTMTPAVPVAFGKLVTVSDLSMYFEADDGTLYVLRPKTSNSFDTRVTVIRRGQ